MSARIVEASATQTDEILPRADRVLSSTIPADTNVFGVEIAMPEPAGEMPLAFWG